MMRPKPIDTPVAHGAISFAAVRSQQGSARTRVSFLALLLLLCIGSPSLRVSAQLSDGLPSANSSPPAAAVATSPPPAAVVPAPAVTAQRPPPAIVFIAPRAPAAVPQMILQIYAPYSVIAAPAIACATVSAAMRSSLNAISSFGGSCNASSYSPPGADVFNTYTSVAYFIPYTNTALASQWVQQAALNATWWYNLYVAMGAGCEVNATTGKQTLRVNGGLVNHPLGTTPISACPSTTAAPSTLCTVQVTCPDPPPGGALIVPGSPTGSTGGTAPGPDSSTQQPASAGSKPNLIAIIVPTIAVPALALAAYGTHVYIRKRREAEESRRINNPLRLRTAEALGVKLPATYTSPHRSGSLDSQAHSNGNGNLMSPARSQSSAHANGNLMSPTRGSGNLTSPARSQSSARFLQWHNSLYAYGEKEANDASKRDQNGSGDAA